MDIIKQTTGSADNERYAVVDIGSNTIVLIIYDSVHPVHVQTYYSEAVYLVTYNAGGIMQEEGIRKTLDVLARYKAILAEEKVDRCFAFITEPWRHLENTEYFLARLRESGFDIDALSGREEAVYDFYGSRIDCADILNGNACDIGGGSTELISFRNGEIHEAYSLPAGCVRLKDLPVTPEVPRSFLNDSFSAAPALLDTPSSELIGIGGTCRACSLLSQELWPGQPISRASVHTLLRGVLDNDTETVSAMDRVLTPGRKPVFAPGLNMLGEIMDAYHAEHLRISEGSVREGYLLRHI